MVEHFTVRSEIPWSTFRGILHVLHRFRLHHWNGQTLRRMLLAYSKTTSRRWRPPTIPILEGEDKIYSKNWRRRPPVYRNTSRRRLICSRTRRRRPPVLAPLCTKTERRLLGKFFLRISSFRMFLLILNFHFQCFSREHPFVHIVPHAQIRTKDSPIAFGLTTKS